jgi:hypothetical protein
MSRPDGTRSTHPLAEIRARALAALIPPPRLALSECIETSVRLPEGVSALSGAVRLWPWQREIADAIGKVWRRDDAIWKTSVLHQPAPARAFA